MFKKQDPLNEEPIAEEPVPDNSPTDGTPAGETAASCGAPQSDPPAGKERVPVRIPLYAVVILVVLAVVVTFNATYLAINEKHNRELNRILASYSYFDSLLSVDEIVKKNYIGEIDENEVRIALLRGYLDGIGDQYSAFMTSTEYDAYTSEQNGNAVGIGVNVIYDAEKGAIEIISVLPDSPAEKIGLSNGDFIVAVGDKQIAEIGYYAAIDLIRGEKETTVDLTVRRGETTFPVTCERREVKTQSILYHVFAGDSRVGVVRITEFNGTTPEQFKNAVETLKAEGCERFVFDLRNNPGGELTSILSVLDYLLPEGPLAHIYYKNGEDSHYTSDAACLDAPMAVLTNGQTASAAELFTSALRDYAAKGTCRATLVGTKTYGKGTLQRFFLLKDGSAFKISVGRYDPPYSENYNGVGILPDIEIELSEEAAAINFNKLTDETDNQLIAAVSALKINP